MKCFKMKCEHSFIDENNDNKSICRFCGVEEQSIKDQLTDLKQMEDKGE